MIELRSEWYYDGIFQGAIPGGDIFGALYKEGPTVDADAPWVLLYRFRYHATPEKHWDNRDKKKWYRMRSEQDRTPEKGDAMRRVFTDLMSLLCTTGAYHLIQGNGDAAMRQLQELMKGEGSGLTSETLRPGELEHYERTGEWPERFRDK